MHTYIDIYKHSLDSAGTVLKHLFCPFAALGFPHLSIALLTCTNRSLQQLVHGLDSCTASVCGKGIVSKGTCCILQLGSDGESLDVPQQLGLDTG